MRKLLTILLGTLCLSAIAQPKWTKKANKALLTLHVLQEQGDTLHAYAFYADEQGTLLAPCRPLRQARKAWVTDSKGTVYPILRFAGANATYNIAKITVQQGKKKPIVLPFVTEKPALGTTVYTLPLAQTDSICKIEQAEGYGYYTLATAVNRPLEGAPVMNSMGEVVAMLQAPLLGSKAKNYALDINIAETLQFSALDVNNKQWAQCHIPHLLPEKEAEATTFLYLAPKADSTLYNTYVADYLQAFPQNATGYVTKAEFLAQHKQYAEAEATYQLALKTLAEHSDEVYYSRARTIYNNVLVKSAGLPDTWTTKQALADARMAYKHNPLPIYQMQEAELSYVLKDFRTAYDRYMELTQTNLRCAQLYAYASLCAEQLGDSISTRIALLDSALACYPTPLTAEAAPYLYMRAMLRSDAGQLREALQDLGEYEHLMQGQLTEKFYYERMHMYLSARRYDAALADAERAIVLNPQEPVNYAEKAAILYRMNEFDRAIEACQQTIAIAPDVPDAYRIMGLAYRRKGNTTEALKQLRQAQDMGDQLAEHLIQEIEK